MLLIAYFSMRNVSNNISVFLIGATWNLNFAENNICIYTGLRPTAKGKYWFEKETLWLDMPQLFWGEKFEAKVYKNPDGSWEVGNQYFFVSAFGIYPFSPDEE